MNPFERTSRVEVNRHLGVTLEKTKNLKEALTLPELKIIKESLEKLEKSSGEYREKVKI